MLPSIENPNFLNKNGSSGLWAGPFCGEKNTAYQNYLEHVRHMFQESPGVKFTDFQHKDLVW